MFKTSSYFFRTSVSPVPTTCENFKSFTQNLKHTSAVLVAQVRESPHVSQVHGEPDDRHEKVGLVWPLLSARSPSPFRRPRHRRRRVAPVPEAALAATAAVFVIRTDHLDCPPPPRQTPPHNPPAHLRKLRAMKNVNIDFNSWDCHEKKSSR